MTIFYRIWWWIKRPFLSFEATHRRNLTPDEMRDYANQVLTNPAFKLVFVDIRETMVLQLEALPLGDKETQHEITLMLQLLKQVKSRLQRYSQSGAMEKHRAKQDSFVQKTRERLV